MQTSVTFRASFFTFDSLRGLEAAIAGHIAHQLGTGKVNVLVFDRSLYREVVDAELDGAPTAGIESFPFPLAIITINDAGEIFGVAAIELAKAPASVRGGIKHGGRCAVAYLLREGGITLSPNARVLAACDRLVMYLDRESVQFDTVYVSGNPTGRIAKEL